MVNNIKIKEKRGCIIKPDVTEKISTEKSLRKSWKEILEAVWMTRMCHFGIISFWVSGAFLNNWIRSPVQGNGHEIRSIRCVKSNELVNRE